MCDELTQFMQLTSSLLASSKQQQPVSQPAWSNPSKVTGAATNSFTFTPFHRNITNALQPFS